MGEPWLRDYMPDDLRDPWLRGLTPGSLHAADSLEPANAWRESATQGMFDKSMDLCSAQANLANDSAEQALIGDFTAKAEAQRGLLHVPDDVLMCICRNVGSTRGGAITLVLLSISCRRFSQMVTEPALIAELALAQNLPQVNSLQVLVIADHCSKIGGCAIVFEGTTLGINADSRTRLEDAAQLLLSVPCLEVQVEAHAGPIISHAPVQRRRGEEELLSCFRARHVGNYLKNYGVDVQRVRERGWGSKISALPNRIDHASTADLYFQYHGLEFPTRSSDYTGFELPPFF